MIKYIIFFTTFLIIKSCGYPDIDAVPNFDKVFLTDEEINDYCTDTNSNKKNVDNCISDYKSKK